MNEALPSRRWLLPLRKAAILSFSLCVPFSGAQAALSEGWLSHWPLEENNFGVAEDAIFSNDMVITGEPVVSPGQVGNAFAFDGSSTYLTISHPTDNTETGLPIYKAGSYSVSMWVKGVPQTGKYLYTEASTFSNSPLFLLQTGQQAANNAKFDVIIRPDAGAPLVDHVVSETVVFDDTWHHITWVDDHGDAKLYVDGVLDGADFSYTPAGNFTMDTSSIGTLVRASVSTGAIFNGQIDEVALWERALTPEEVTELYNNGLPSNPPDQEPTFRTPITDVTVNIGDWHVFEADVAGVRPFTFKWFRNGEEIPDATERTLRVSDLTVDNSGDVYTVEVTNPFGTVTSPGATVTVLADPAANVRAGLLNYWPLDQILESDGLLISPDLYSGNDMILVNFPDTTATVPGQFGNALFFDSVTQYTYRTNGAPISLHTNYSISMWVKGDPTGMSDARVFSEGTAEAGLNHVLFTIGTGTTASSPYARIYITSDSAGAAEVSSRQSTRPVFDDTWHHIVWTDANGEGKLYVDGVLDETDFSYTRNPRSVDVTSLAAVVRAAVGNYFYGAIDEVATWNRVLSWTEIQEIRDNSIPERLELIAPNIIADPVVPVNGIFEDDTIRLNVQYTGSLPVNFQWYRNDELISGEDNPSALTRTLTIPGAKPAASGEYRVVVSNTAGDASSAVVDVEVIPYVPITSGEVLAVDVGPASNLQPGFSSFTMANNGSRYNGVKLTVSGTNPAERNRTSGDVVVNSEPDLTLAAVYNDFIFNNNTTDGTGLTILLERLAPNTPHEVTIWSFDPVSNGDRVSDWTETSSGTPIEIQTGYTFNGTTHPTSDLSHALQAVLTSSPEGTLQIEAVKMGGSGVAAFFNGIRLVANPGAGGTVEITGSELVAGKVRITVQSTGEQPVALEQNSDLGSDTWVPATNVTVVSSEGSTTVLEVPADDPHMFYRAVLSE